MDLLKIEGIQKNAKVIGQCFKTKVLGETIQVPVPFITKLGIFNYTREDGKAFLHALHLSYLEFCAAASLCRTNVDIYEYQRHNPGYRA